MDRPAPLSMFPSCFVHPRPPAFISVEGNRAGFSPRPVVDGRVRLSRRAGSSYGGVAELPVYMARGTHPNVDVLSPHRLMIVSSSSRLLREVYVELSWRRVAVFEVCERILLGFAVTSLHIQTGGGLPDTPSASYLLSSFSRYRVSGWESLLVNPRRVFTAGKYNNPHARSHSSARENPSHRILTQQSHIVNIL